MQNQLGKDYLIIKEIGEGNFGKVYLGKHRKSYQDIAIKVLEKNKFDGKEDLVRVNIELKILMTIDHPNIVQLLDYKFTQDYIFFIMEYVEGGELFQLIRKRKLSEKECFQFFEQIFSAVEYLHSINITHRDLKPENLMLASNCTQVKLVDFGLSRFYQKNLGCQTACGSPCYAPPEMIYENNYDPEKAEVWSLGMVLYAMSVGKLPVYGDDTEEIYKFLSKNQIHYPKDIDKGLKKFLKKMLETDKKQRALFIELKNDEWFIKWDCQLQFENCNLYRTLSQKKEEIKIDDNLVLNLSIAYCMNFDKLKNYVKKRNLKYGIYCHYWLLKNKQKSKAQIKQQQHITNDIQNLFVYEQKQVYKNFLIFLQNKYKGYTIIQNLRRRKVQGCSNYNIM